MNMYVSLDSLVRLQSCPNMSVRETPCYAEPNNNPSRHTDAYNTLGSLLPSPASALLSSIFDHSLNSFFNIFPLAVFGIAPTNLTPAVNHLNLANLSRTHRPSSSSVTPILSPTPLNSSFFLTTYALINSPTSSFPGIPMTAASRTSGCCKRIASISAGATWKPRTLIISRRRSMIYHSPSLSFVLLRTFRLGATPL